MLIGNIGRKRGGRVDLCIVTSIATDGTFEVLEIPEEGARELQKMVIERLPDENKLVPLVLDRCTMLIMRKCYFFQTYNGLVYCIIVGMLKWVKKHKNIFFPNNLFFSYLEKIVNKKICKGCACGVCPMSSNYNRYALPDDI